MAFNSLGSNRDQIINLAVAERNELLRRNVLIVDPRRQRPNWFNGRFLAASDLANEQNYFLLRQADHGRAAGSGVVEGLLVSELANVATNSDRLRIEAGHGVTDTGELVVLRDGIEFDPANVPELQRLDSAFGLRPIPAEPGRVRTGLYVVALRPVEWTANPISAYPTSLTGPRTVEDGEIIEGVAVSLIPLPGTPDDISWTRRRARAAREIFVDGRKQGQASGALPLALVALRGNLVEWVDPFLVRRETGAERPVGMDFGFGDRALREAHLIQYDNQLQDVVVAANQQPFVASDWFEALPPVGRLPSNTLNGTNLTQRFFPVGIQVELAFLPQDELSALIEEALLLPPLDLTLETAQLEGTTVIALVPMLRADYNANRTALAGARRLTTPLLINRSLARPIDILLGRNSAFTGTGPVIAGVDDFWKVTLRAQIQAQPFFWFVRRRHVPQGVNVPGTSVDASSGGLVDLGGLVILAAEDPEIHRNLAHLRELDRPEVNVLARRLGDRRFVDNPRLLKAVLAKAAKAAASGKPVSDVVSALAPVANPALGEGLSRLATRDPGLVRELNEGASDDQTFHAVDVAAASLESSEQLKAFAREVRAGGNTLTARGLSESASRIRKAHAPPPPPTVISKAVRRTKKSTPSQPVTAAPNPPEDRTSPSYPIEPTTARPPRKSRSPRSPKPPTPTA